jgi:hypothetical protein
MKGNDNIIIRQKTVSNRLDAFKLWLLFTKGIHQLTPVEMDFFALLLYRRYELEAKINDTELLNEYLFSTKSKKEYQKKMGFIEPTRIPNLLTKLRKKGVLLSENEINPAYIPNLSENFINFELRFIVKVKEDEKRQ